VKGDAKLSAPVDKDKKSKNVSRRELIGRCDSLYIWHKDPIYRMALAAVGGDRDWALEILEACMTRAYHYIEKFEDVQSDRSKCLMAAIFQSTLNEVYRSARNSAGIPAGQKPPVVSRKDKLDVDQILVRNELSAGLAKDVEKLSQTEKELLFFRFFVGLTEQEVCDHFGIGAPELRDRVFQVKQKLSEMIVERQNFPERMMERQ